MSGKSKVGRPPVDPAERFWTKVTPTGFCWEWAAGLDRDGYGVFYCNEKKGKVKAHRRSYELLVGAIPAGLVIDHWCRNRKCVNPDHLRPATPRENSLNRPIVTSPRCGNGHDKATNTMPSGLCRACAYDRKRKFRARTSVPDDEKINVWAGTEGPAPEYPTSSDAWEED